jgi:hypothetical protein
MLQLQKHVPDLSTCISKLISSSSDMHFKAACAEILHLQSSEFSVVEPEIRARLLHILEDSDKLPSARRTGALQFRSQDLKDKRSFLNGYQMQNESCDSLGDDSESEDSFKGIDKWE